MSESGGGAAATARHILFSTRAAAEAVGNNKLRAGLTSLGILFGVASVIAMLAIGKGAEQEILEQMRLLGTNNVIITPAEEEQREGAVERDEGRPEPKRFSPGLTMLDARSIAAIVPNVVSTSGEIVLNTALTREGHRRSGKLVGVDTSYFGLQNLRVIDGALFSGQHVSTGAPVAIIGHGVRTRFFTRDAPVGGRIKVGDVWLTVVGVLEDRMVASETAQRLGIRDANMDVYVPLSTALLRYRNRARVTTSDIERASRPQQVIQMEDAASQDEEARAERRNYHQLDKIIVHVEQASVVPAVAEVLQRMLTRRHNNVIDFEITVPELLLRQEQRTKTIFNVVLGAIASISLVVGGIGIMNIMLASVLERIREIGVRRAVGATQRDVLLQFLGEAVMISLAGGIMGIVTGATLSAGIQRLAGITTIVSPMSVVVAFGVSVAVGLLFGIVPAWRAARQDPVVCLRYE
ncbi:MAG TPA: ABC transporter permease [Gemmatimonadaceae bacterium]|nr:ABC transporter permease [Gemmatimonadaceae bacterium]